MEEFRPEPGDPPRQDVTHGCTPDPTCAESRSAEPPRDAPENNRPIGVKDGGAPSEGTVMAPLLRRHPPPEEPPGRVVGDFELLGRIARGGRGVVYRARQVSLDRLVALKMIGAGEFASEEEIERFHTEARAAARLDHPGVVPVYEVGQEAGHHFYAMGLVEGGNLARRVREGPLPPWLAATLVERVARAVAYAHGQGVVHRDLKPSNILLNRDGQPKVADFGLAKDAREDSQLTTTGQILGTPSYMPPEQALGRTQSIGPLSDVYSLGAVLYCLLTGRPPFQAASKIETLRQVVEQEPVARRRLNAAIDRDLETVTLRCLQKDPGRRYESARSLAEDLGRWLDGKPIVARPVGRAERAWRWCRRNPAVAGLTAAVAALLAGSAVVSGYLAVRAGRGESLAIQKGNEAVAEAARAQALKDLSDRNAYAAIMNSAYEAWKDGRITALDQILEDLENRQSDLVALRGFEWGYLRRLCHLELVNRGGQEAVVRTVSYSADGRWLASGAGKHVTIWDVAGTRAVKALSGFRGPVSRVVFSPDAGRLAVVDGDTVTVWTAPGWERVRTVGRQSAAFVGAAFGPGGRLAVGEGETVGVWDTNTGTKLRSFNGHSHRVVACRRTAMRRRSLHSVSGCDWKATKKSRALGSWALWSLGVGESFRSWPPSGRCCRGGAPRPRSR